MKKVSSPAHIPRRSCSAILATSIVTLMGGAVLYCPPSAAAQLFWDQGGTGTSGNWNHTTVNWSTVTPPTAATVAWTDNNVAQFSGTGGTVTINDDINAIVATGLTFTTNGYNITDDLGGAASLQMDGATTITVNPSISATITTSINSIFSASTLTINGGGTLNLAGVNSGAYFGNSITISGGTTVVAQVNPSATTGDFALPSNGAFSITGSSTLDMNGTNQSIASLAGTAGSIVTNTSATYGTITIGSSAPNSPTTFAGNITDTAAAIETSNSLTPAGGLGVKISGATTGYTLILSGTNTYHGITTVGSDSDANASVLQAGAANTFSPNSVVDVRTNATLDLNGTAQSIAALDGTGAGVVTNTSPATTATLTIGNASLTGTLTSAASLVDTNPGNGKLALTKNGTYTQILSGNNNYSGATAVNAGTLASGSTTGLSANSAFTVGASGTLDVNGFSGSLGSLTGSGGVINGGGAVTGPTLGNAILTTGSDATSTSFSGSLKDGTSGTLGLTKTGSGNFTISGTTNTYSGPTVINGGALVVTNASGSATGTSTVDIKSGGTLGGSGTVSGAMTLESGGTIAPGVVMLGSTLHGSSLTWNGGGTLSLQLGTTSDKLALTGALTKGTAGIFDVNLSDSGGIASQTLYTLATFGSNVGFVASDFTLATPGLNGTFSLSATELDFTLTGITTTGPIIQNSAPVNTPTIADFIVIGPVTTGGPTENNQIHTLTFQPGGSLLIHNTLTVTQGPVILVGGSSITLDGSLQVSELRMLIGSLLNGNGSILGNLVNGGFVSPGHSPGLIHVSGNYTQTPTGALRIDIGGTDITQHDLLSVGGSANLNGTLQLVRLNGFTLTKRNESVTFLTADGGVGGKFATVLSDDFSNGTILVPTVVYDATSVQLVAKQGSFEKFADHEGLTPNQKSVARGLESVAFRNTPPKMIDYLDSRKLSKLPGDFDKIAPDELTSMFTISTAYAKVQSLNLQRRTDDIRSGSSGFSAAGLAINGISPSYSGAFGINTGVAGPNGDDGKESKEMKSILPPETRWGAFLSGTGEWVNVSGTDNARGYNLESGGFTLGIDYKVTSNIAVGLAFGYTGTTADLTDRGRVWTNGGKLGLYATFFQNQPQAPAMSKDSKEVPAAASVAKGFYVDVAAFGGYNSYDTRRSALQGEARGDTDGGEIDALVGTGYDFKAGNLTFGPTASFNYTYAGTNAFTEYNSLAPLDIHGGHGESLRTAFGLKASYDWKVGGVLIKPELRVAWQHEYGDSSYALTSNFANEGGDSFRVNGPEVGRDSALIGAGFAVQFNERASLYFYYDGEFAQGYTSNSVTGGFRLAF